ncbi:MAG: cadherin-like domain-containing protein, partial [Anaerolineales bacterium]
MIDGQELVPCPDTSSAGCSAGGTHAVWQENFTRIRRDAERNVWEVTAKDGTRYVYEASGTFSATAPSGEAETRQAREYKYLLSSKIDTSGNKVNFRYSCDDFVSCRVTSIDYGPSQVVFHWVTRPDEVTFGAGYRLGRLSQRIGVIEVRSIGSLLRAYDLGYTQSVATKRSMLTSVQEYGRDAVITAGKVTSGTTMPAYAFQYSGDAPGIKGHPAGEAFQVPSSNGLGYGTLIGVTYGDIGLDRRLYTVSLTGVSQPVGGSDMGNVEHKCILLRDDTQDLHHTTTRNSCEGFAFSASFIRSQKNSKKIIIYKYHESLCSGPDCNHYYIVQHGNGAESPYGYPNIVADFDGDGLDDGLMLPGNEKEVRTGYASFPKPTTATQYYSAAAQKNWSNLPNRALARDVDGDGLADLFFKEGDRLVVRRSNGRNSFVEIINKPIGSFYSVVGSGDFNGDGLGDFIVSVDGQFRFRIWFNTGNDLVDGGEFYLPNITPPSAWSENTPYDNIPFLIVDVDADGRDDLVEDNRDGVTNRNFDVYLNRTEGVIASIGAGGNTFEFSGRIAFVEDRDFNGVPEIAYGSYEVGNGGISGTGQLPVYLFKSDRYAVISSRPDLLTFVKEPLGGETKITYSYQRLVDEPDINTPFVTVASVETYDGRRNRVTTSFSYSNGRWNWAERMFLGFEKVTAFLPKLSGESNSPRIETIYRQDLAALGRIASVTRFDGAGTVLEKVEETYQTVQSRKPYRALNISTLKTLTFSDAIRKTQIDRSFDTFGNLRSEINYGDLDNPVDNRLRVISYTSNPAAYIVSKPSVETIYAGQVQNSVNAELETTYFYDGAGTSSAAPVKGLLTKVQFVSGARNQPQPGPAARVAFVRGYDAQGNLVSEADGAGNITRYHYDPSYNLFLVRKQLPISQRDGRHNIYTAWDMVCGLPSLVTDENATKTSYTYDALCRKVQETQPTGGYTKYSYLNLGNAATNAIEARTKHPASGEIISRSRLDGFGREIAKIEYGSSLSNPDAITVETDYDARGNIERKSNPRTSAAASAWTVFGYDGLDRPVTTTLPNGTVSVVNYRGGDAFIARESIDVLGNKVVSHLDAFGNEFYRDRYLNGTPLRLSRRYDLLNQQTGVQDELGAVWTYRYDASGNRIAEFDPDRGCQNYVYDAANRLLSQHYSDGGTVAFTYDENDRVTSRTANKTALQYPDCRYMDVNFDYRRNSKRKPNNAPVANGDGPFDVEAGNYITLTSAQLLNNDSDVDGDTLSLSRVFGQVNVQAELLANKTVRVKAPANGLGSASFSYEVTDGSLTASATVQIIIKERTVVPGTVTFTSSGNFVIPS